MTWLAGLLILAGVGFFLAGSLGLIRLPDLQSRLHALTKADNLGLGFVCLGLAVLQADWMFALKLLMIWLLVMAASAVSAYLIAHHANSEPPAGEEDCR